jgi:serine protease Do
MGSAFAISQDGWWLTARHVVDGCEAIGLIVSPRRGLSRGRCEARGVR